jgi:hypothetical protein
LFTGFEKDKFRVFYSKIVSSLVQSNVVFKQGDLFEVDLSAFDALYLYLPRPVVHKFSVEIYPTLKKGVYVITNTVALSGIKPLKTLVVHLDNPDYEKIFIYKV